MPYIKTKDREEFDSSIDDLVYKLSFVSDDKRAGTLNYIISKLLHKYLGSDARYANYNEVMGVLACVQAELYRRRIVVYEDTKCKTEGDVFI